MKNYSIKNRSKGSVLIAVIGILAVLSVLALRFNVEMETAMIKTTGKSLASDVKTLANSGKNYVISKLLENGKSYKAPAPASNDHTQLLMEENMELLNDVDPKLDVMGNGVCEFVARFNSINFYQNINATMSQGYIPDAINLTPGNITFMIEDLTGKLPASRVSQSYQRHLISTVLLKLLRGKVPTHPTIPVKTELFEDTEVTASTESKEYDQNAYVRSLIPYEVAKNLPAGSTDHLNANGIPLYDGILVSEEIGSNYTHIKGTISDSAKTLATDYPRSTKDYRLLSGALTPFARFSHETNFIDGSTAPSEVSYAIINPMVMYHQNFGLYQALFYYSQTDYRLKMQYSVSFPPVVNTVATDNMLGMKSALADPSYFWNNNIGNNGTPDMITTAMPALTISATSSAPGLPFAYNARNDGSDTHMPNDPNFFALDPVIVPAPASLTLDKVKSWNDREFLVAPDNTYNYYGAMAKAVERLSRAFKGTGIHSLPAENVMCPIMIRKSLELAIVQAVFGDSILFVISDIDNVTGLPSPRKRLIHNYDYNTVPGSTSPNTMGSVNYLRLFRAIQNNEIKLENVKFVENAFSKFGDALADKYFVPYWKNFDENVKSSDKYTPAAGNALNIKVPAFGLSYDGADYVNYLPHPQTDQRKLDQSYVSLAIAYSIERKAEVASAGATPLNISKLYLPGVVAGASAKINVGDLTDAYLDLSTAPHTVVTPMPVSGDKYVALLDVNTAGVNFKPADFTPYETKIRMAVLVNLLNALIPAKISPTKNVALGEENTTLFSIANTGAVANNLKEFIYFQNGQYYVNDNFEAPILNKVNLPKYLKGWKGGIQAPGMTFWKYGVNSTTFQITVDAFKYDDSARLSTVVTFDMYDDTFDGTKVYTGAVKETSNDHSKAKYELSAGVKNDPDVFSTIYLNPKGRAQIAPKNANEFVIGNGRMRYPTDSNTDSWRILSSVWSSTFGRNGQEINNYFVPILLFPEDVANLGPDGGNWHFVPNIKEPTYTKFFTNSVGSSHISFPSMWTPADDYSTGGLIKRFYPFGPGSWVKWKVTFTKSMAANKLDVMMVTRGTGGTGYENKHIIRIIRVKDGQNLGDINISTYCENNPMPKKKTIPYALEAGDYYIYLIEVKGSDTTSGWHEGVSKVSIYAN